MEHLYNMLLEQIYYSENLTLEEKKEECWHLSKIFMKLYGVGKWKESTVRDTMMAVNDSDSEFVFRKPKQSELIEEFDKLKALSNNDDEFVELIMEYIIDNYQLKTDIPTKQKLVNFVKAVNFIREIPDNETKTDVFNEVLERMCYILYPHSDFVNKKEVSRILS